MDLLIEVTLGIWMVALGVGGLRHRIHSTIVELDAYWNRSKNDGLQPTLLNTTMKASRKQDMVSSCQHPPNHGPAHAIENTHGSRAQHSVEACLEASFAT